MSGKIMARRGMALEKNSGAIVWKELYGLPAGVYFIRMQVNNSDWGNSAFFKL